MLSATDLAHLRRCIELATEAADAGDEPFGSLLADAEGTVLFEDRNREITTGDPTAHPEIAIARWAAEHLTAEERATATTYTSGEHCPMCSAAHGWVGLGPIVFVHSADQLTAWRGRPASPVRLFPIREVLPATEVTGPVPELVEEMRALHQRSGS